MPLTASEHYDVAEYCLADAENASTEAEQLYFVTKAAAHATLALAGLQAIDVRKSHGKRLAGPGQFGMTDG